MKQKIKQYFSKPMNVVIFIEFLLVLLLNLFVVTTSDDLGYQINHGLIDIFKREYIQYMTWTGRTVAHIFARIFLALPKIIFDICNSLCFVFFTYLIYLHVTKDKQRKHYILYIIICLLVLESSAPVGSSAKIISGLFTIALAIATLCIWPPDN